MTFEIIKNAPMLPVARRGPPAIYPFEALVEVGDAFDAPRDMGKKKNGADVRRTSIGSCATSWAKGHNSTAKFTVQIIDEHTVRCQRIA